MQAQELAAHQVRVPSDSRLETLPSSRVEPTSRFTSEFLKLRFMRCIPAISREKFWVEGIAHQVKLSNMGVA